MLGGSKIKFRIMAAVVILLSCYYSLASQSNSSPDLPQLIFDNFAPTIREQVKKAYDDAQKNSRDASAVGRLGMVLHTYDQHEMAESCYKRALQLEPDSFQWLYYLGTVQAILGKQTEAAATLAKAVRLNPNYLPAQLKLAESLMASGQLRESQQIYEDVRRSTLNVEHRTSDVEHTMAVAYYGLGRVKAAQRDMASAAEYYRRAVELYKNFGAAHYGLALAYRDLGQTAKAQEHLALYQKDKLGWPPLADPLIGAIRELNAGAQEHLRRGISLEVAGQIAESIAEHEKALEINPQLIQAHVNLIILYGKLGQAEKAEKHYRAAIEINPNQAESHYNYGVLLVGQEKYREAAEAFKKALEINPYYAEAHHNYGSMVEREGRLDEAAEHYRIAIENKPNYRLAHFHLGRILLHQGKNKEAIDHFLKTLSPEDDSTPGFMYALGAAYARTGDRQSAIQYIRGARERAIAFGQTQLLSLIERDLKILERR